MKINYPTSAQQRGAQGRVYVSFVVDENGDVVAAWVARSTGHHELDMEAVRVIKRAKFKPGLKDDKPVKVRMNMPISFH